jgi:nucleoside-diphosphate-sugar epimerase
LDHPRFESRTGVSSILAKDGDRPVHIGVVGARGFVGSAFVRQLTFEGFPLTGLTRENYAAGAGAPIDVLVDASGNSTKYLAETDPLADFDRTVRQRMLTLRDFPSAFHVHLSSVDVYDDLTSPATTSEEAPIDRTKTSLYGLHKLLAEDLVRRHAARWIVLRLAGMVGPGLRKNPIFDVLAQRPLRIHPASQYQFMATDEVARIALELLRLGHANETFNVCGDGLVSPSDASAIAGIPFDSSLIPRGATPRVVDASIERLSRIVCVPSSMEAVVQYIRSRSERARSTTDESPSRPVD